MKIQNYPSFLTRQPLILGLTIFQVIICGIILALSMIFTNLDHYALFLIIFLLVIFNILNRFLPKHLLYFYFQKKDYLNHD